MSSSTVYVTPANVTATETPRRRPVPLGERNQNIIEQQHTDVTKLKNDTILEDSVKLDKAKASTTPVRRPRKAVAKTETRKWEQMVTVVTKNLVLLVVLIGLVQLVRKLGDKDKQLVRSFSGLSDFEARIADVESRFKTTARMMQARIEGVGEKFESGIGGLRKELEETIEGKTVGLECRLSEMEYKREGLEKSFSELELKIGDWLEKEELDKLYEEVVKNGKGNDNDLSLDDVKLYAKEVMMKEIEKHEADGLGRVDYALAMGGGIVVKHSEPYFNQGVNWLLNGMCRVHKDAEKMLKPSFGEPGECFPLKGSSGFVQIKLRMAILPEAITIEHVAKLPYSSIDGVDINASWSVAYDRSSAPNHCRVSGWLQGQNSDVKRYLLTEFSYDLEKSNAQTFSVLDSVSTSVIDTVRLDFLSNHGASSHTCIYRMRVHGREPESVLMTAMQS
ncbi:hypothetical protein ACFE04_002619 [Oxalis oulophora]